MDRTNVISPNTGRQIACWAPDDASTTEQAQLAREFADAMRWQYVPAVGTFYLFPKLPDVARFSALAAERDVYLLAGDIFGPSYGDHVRFCFGKPLEELRAMLDCLADIAVAA